MEKMIILMIFLALVLPSILILVNTYLNKKNTMSREKSSPFECGFDPKSSARLPFSMRFYLIAVIFLIFDIEITLILPIPMSYNTNNISLWLLLSSLFIFILLLGLYHEWNQGALKWAS